MCFACLKHILCPHHSVLGVQHNCPFLVKCVKALKQRLGHAQPPHMHVLDDGSQLFVVTDQNNLKVTLSDIVKAGGTL